jgi:hypothetical protein
MSHMIDLGKPNCNKRFLFICANDGTRFMETMYSMTKT